MDKSLLFLADDAPLRGRLRRVMDVRFFEVMDSGTVRDWINIVLNHPPAFASPPDRSGGDPLPWFSHGAHVTRVNRWFSVFWEC